ncbi:GspE/PulE family protein [Henriciella sp.]|uniref:GspE/PulE family protein n=1 Tax=Henriciella sp. TaxID=1968823 RepID=UPI0026150F97|nr:type II/IV secretion system protein [Henriciella sp.]
MRGLQSPKDGRTDNVEPLKDTPEYRLGRQLVDWGDLSEARLSRAVLSANRAGESLSAVLVKLGFCAEERVAEALSSVLEIPFLRRADFPAGLADMAGLKQDYFLDNNIAPIETGSGELMLLMADPLNDELLHAVAYKTGERVARGVALAGELRDWMASLKPAPEEVALPDFAANEDVSADDLERLMDLARGAPVVRWVDELLTAAVEARASDIHIEPERDTLRVRYRIDGVLVPVDRPLAGLPEAVVSRIKILAKLNIAERRLPQDGRIRTAVQGREIDLRIATLPSIYGETVVMRILDQSAAELSLESLGLTIGARGRLEKAISEPYGITLVTGPTGSGKTTTLYASLKHLMSPDLKFMSVEDPVEYEIAGVSQVQVKPDIGLTFASTLRSVLRHDPNVLMIGEIRDLETASIAIEASLTGHTVLSTVHTNSAAATITRLIEMGVEDYLVATTVNAIAAQRLLRLLCPACATPSAPPPALEERLAGIVGTGSHNGWRKPVGCNACRQTGYRGRMSVAEVMPVSEAIQSAILRKETEPEIRRRAIEEGMIPLFDAGVQLAAQGRTSLEEVFAVIGSGRL